MSPKSCAEEDEKTQRKPYPRKKKESDPDAR